MSLDERARRAAAGIRLAVEEREQRSPLDPSERFDARRARTERTQRLAAGVVGVGVAALAIVFAIRALAPSGSSVPSTPSPPAGRVLVGAWDPRTDTAHWYTVGTDGSGKTDLGIDATCSVWFPDGRRILITDDASGFPLRPAILSPEGSLIARLDATRDPGLNLGCGDVSPTARGSCSRGSRTPTPPIGTASTR